MDPCLNGSMSEWIDSCRPFFMVSAGAILGSWMRLRLANYFGSILTANYWGTLVVNILSAFFLGFVLALHAHSGDDYVIKNPAWSLFVCIGFLGSFSTFSTFVSELLHTLRAHSWKQFFSLVVFSLIGGLLAALAGLTLGDV